MGFSRWYRHLRPILKAPKPGPRARRCRLVVEVLEQRALLSGGVADPGIAAPVDSTNPAATAPGGTTVVESTTPGAPGATQHGPDGPTDAQNGYPLPPTTGPAIPGGIGADSTPVTVMPTPPGGATPPTSPPPVVIVPSSGAPQTSAGVLSPSNTPASSLTPTGSLTMTPSSSISTVVVTPPAALPPDATPLPIVLASVQRSSAARGLHHGHAHPAHVVHHHHTHPA